ncbi:putative cytokinetic ring protein SteA [Peptostreptococcus equinus]|uniref:Cytokinetic ring protein SteA n=1 Tax=Peptostreptococcus equinus TaxID=3003601 RepID=A0ABY7JQJ6_9FIRM|nr:putative cytokinetic ring protein SteA [Peptostreptococcus sp. CBA3647]WAW15624.1 putative cytokinetic ring protein SteA [Peptostreptococcus sp. CBA3647]
MRVEAKMRKDRKTKKLAKRIEAGQIAVINHIDLDEVAARSLVEAKVRLVINADESISGRYPNAGPEILVDNGILIIDNIGKEAFDLLEENDTILVEDGKIFKNGLQVASGLLMDKEVVVQKIKDAYDNIGEELDRFIDNTIEYAKKEKGLILGDVPIPKMSTVYDERHVLVVVRGHNYKSDLQMMLSYIEEVKPILVGVDGGADALMEFGYTPDVVVGDMDSVSDEALKAAKEIVVHAYVDGRAPGLGRVENLGLKSVVMPSPGTSEDIAMLIAYEYNAKLIVALGTHSNMIDFLEKGRKGMASTFLVRLKIGAKLVDAKGVSTLYKSRLKFKYIIALILTALFPVLIIASLSPKAQTFMQLLQLKLKLLLNI